MGEAERLCDWVTIVEHGRLIEVGRTEELVSWHCPQRTVVLATGEPIAEERLRHPARRDGDLAKFSVHDSTAGPRLCHCRDPLPLREPHSCHRLPDRAPPPRGRLFFLKLTGNSFRD